MAAKRTDARAAERLLLIIPLTWVLIAFPRLLAVRRRADMASCCSRSGCLRRRAIACRDPAPLSISAAWTTHIFGIACRTHHRRDLPKRCGRRSTPSTSACSRRTRPGPALMTAPVALIGLLPPSLRGIGSETQNASPSSYRRHADPSLGSSCAPAHVAHARRQFRRAPLRSGKLRRLRETIRMPGQQVRHGNVPPRSVRRDHGLREVTRSSLPEVKKVKAGGRAGAIKEVLPGDIKPR